MLPIGKWLFAGVMLLYNSHLYAQIRLPRLVRDSMVLQRDVPATIWGWAGANEKLTIQFNNKRFKTKAGADGKWRVQLPPTAAGGPYEIKLAASNAITLREVLFGDVWFCSGQSNMVHQMELHNITYANDIAAANYPHIRQFWIPTLANLEGPQTDLPAGNWKPATSTDVLKFSAVAYFFARDIYEKYHVPIGIINASVGGTPAEAWMSEAGLNAFETILKTLQQNKDTAWVRETNKAAAAAPRRYTSPDLGMTGSKKWLDSSYIPEGWRTIHVPGYWEDQGIRDLDGVVWYRREIDIPESMAGKAASVFLGRIVDADELYINGKLVGNTTYQYPQRRYNVPASLLKSGKNVFVVRVTNNSGKGGFVPDKPYCIFSGNDTVDLKGTWYYKVGAVSEPLKPGTGVAAINAQNQPAALFNAMVAPVIPYAIKGILWYQGEANTSRAAEYAKIMSALILDWRKQFNQPKLPFLYVQLPGFMDYNYQPAQSQWAQLREAQLQILQVPHTAMAVAIDLGEWNDIHPDNKKEVGLRLSLAARKMVYGENIVASGPLFQSVTRDSNRLVILFKETGSGLVTRDGGEPAELAIAGADKQFVWARASIEGNKLIVWNDSVPDPVYIRYAWADNPVNPNLYNKEGLPASPFRTDQ
ncbi:MAG: sialate O-acetylesterase [Bacteroidetes bacterium]|nr:sialate O-acetylesterase [Bacteroidota bacterium]